MLGYVALFVVLLIGLVLVLSRLKPRYKRRGTVASPAKLGLQTTLKSLLAAQNAYDLYYSGPRRNPSALLFVPKASVFVWELDTGTKGWTPLAAPGDVDEIVRALGDLDIAQRAVLKVVLPPANITGAEEGLCYVLTHGYLAPRRASDAEDRFLIPPVREIKKAKDNNK